MTQQLRDEDPEIPQLGGIHPEVNPLLSPDIRTPITLSPATTPIINDSSDGSIHDVDDEEFWTTWLQEIRLDELQTTCVADDPWEQVCFNQRPPDTTWEADVGLCGYEYLHALTVSLPRSICESPLQSQQQRSIDQQVQTRTDYIVQQLVQQPAELQMLAWLAFVSGYLPDDVQFCYEDVAVFMIDNNQTKQVILERNNTQTNFNCTDEDIRKNPELVRAAISVEIKRWLDTDSIRRRLRRNAHNLLTSRYVMTWKRGEDGVRFMKCRLCVHGFKD
jgi:hypothetical protein